MAQAHKFRKAKSLFSTTLSVGISTGTGETITLSSTTGLPTDTEVTLTFDRVDADGTPTPVKVERITGIVSGVNIITYTRAIDGTTDQAHSAGCVVEYIWNADDLNDLVDGLLVQHDQSGLHKSAALDSMISGTEAEGDIMYRNATVWARLAKGTASQVLKMNAGVTAPEWVTMSANRAFTWYLDGTSIVADEVGAKYIAPQNLTVVSIKAKTVSGTATIRVQKGTTDIDASISVTSSVATETSITSAAITANDVITLDITAASSCVGLTVTVECSQP